MGLSSGLSWLAWAAGIPVVMISGFTHPTNEFATPYRVINYHACNGCWNDVRAQVRPQGFPVVPAPQEHAAAVRVHAPDHRRAGARDDPPRAGDGRAGGRRGLNRGCQPGCHGPAISGQLRVGGGLRYGRAMERITFNPAQCGGRPCIRGLRIRVKDVLDLFASGVDEAEILADFPALEPDDISACLAFAAAEADHPVLLSTGQ